MKCTNCGNELPEGALFCGGCGNKMTSAKKIFCANCGKELKPGSDFCANCGNKMKGEEGKHCPKCGNLIKDGITFCGKCGYKLDSSVPEVKEETPQVNTFEQLAPITEEKIPEIKEEPKEEVKLPEIKEEPKIEIKLPEIKEEIKKEVEITQVEQPRVKIERQCPNCGNTLKEGVVFCNVCGTSLGGNSAKVTPDTKEVPAEKKGRALNIIIIALLLVIVLLVSTIVGYVMFSRNDKNNEVEEVVVIEETTASVQVEETEEIVVEVETEEQKYLFPSDEVYITEADLAGLTKSEVALIRNEIYARHGYMFNNQEYRDYFGAKDWYYPNENFDESMFNSIEKANKDYLVQYEKKMGWR